ncbi:unnamed protein product [Caenorhabditis sp. 36 PRJEB53466]|nr:unnamed protein product [Caenorhabditis sp. 36 PRJEB53466]
MSNVASIESSLLEELRQSSGTSSPIQVIVSLKELEEMVSKMVLEHQDCAVEPAHSDSTTFDVDEIGEVNATLGRLRAEVTISNEINRREISELRAENAALKAEIEELKRKKKKSTGESIRAKINGGWRMVSSTGVDQFVDMLTEKFVWRDFDSVIFKMKEQYFNLKKNKFESWGELLNKKLNRVSATLGEPLERFGKVSTTVLWKDTLTTDVRSSSGEGMLQLKHFIRDDHLHVVATGQGLTCERVYVKMEDKEVEEPAKPAEKQDIFEAIVGKWILVESENFEEFIALNITEEEEEQRLRSKSLTYTKEGDRLIMATPLTPGGEDSLCREDILNRWIDLQGNFSQFVFVDNNRLITMEKLTDTDEVQWRCIEWIGEDGRLTVAEEQNGIVCTRIFKRY